MSGGSQGIGGTGPTKEPEHTQGPSGNPPSQGRGVEFKTTGDLKAALIAQYGPEEGEKAFNKFASGLAMSLMSTVKKPKTQKWAKPS